MGWRVDVLENQTPPTADFEESNYAMKSGSLGTSSRTEVGLLPIWVMIVFQSCRQSLRLLLTVTIYF